MHHASKEFLIVMLLTDRSTLHGLSWMISLDRSGHRQRGRAPKQGESGAGYGAMPCWKGPFRLSNRDFPPAHGDID